MQPPIPSFGKLQHALREVLRHFRRIADDASGPSIDVRICMRVNGSWWIAEGDVSYDAEHAPFCVASVLHVSMIDTEIDEVLRDMCSDLTDQIACDGAS